MANTYKALSTVTVGAGGAATIDFTNIPQTYTDLVILTSLKNTSTSPDVAVRINNTSATYTNIYFYNNQNTPASITDSTGTGFYAAVNRASYGANTFANNSITIPNYANNTSIKTASIDNVTEANTASIITNLLIAGRYTGTDPVTRVTLIPGNGTFEQYSTATLYGVFNADVSSAPATPTIGTASVASATSASITFTPVSNAASYTMTSTPSSITATGTSSPIIVTGLTTETAYTFKVKSNNPFGSSAESAASNSVTPSTAAYESIATATVGAGGTSTITFNSIPQNYTHLQIRFYATGSGGNIPISFNSSGGGYSWQYNGSTGNTTTNSNSGSGGVSGTFISHAIAGSTNWTAGVCDITEYTNTSKAKTFRSITGYSNNTTSGNWFLLNQGIWNNTSAITRIDLGSATLAEGTKFALYGIRS